ncbi:hypothetical protein EC957_008645 [Mortierella hygrophila]|uniref:Uncharacterized protein n=1 Tax=Mortierella hygrophila TaxID=979708 RepID=A0A9P6FC20_9FUNG|nr:hypothetical protein EC957_008645 [Mortierella hygrophila]
MSFATSIPSTTLPEEVGKATQPLPTVFAPAPCPGESSTGAPTGASAGVKKRRGRPKGSTKVKKVTAVATAGEQATVNQTDGEGAATHDNDFDSHINDNDMVQAANDTNPDNNNNNNNNPDDNNTITSSQTDLYSVLGPDRVDMFYDDGVIYGYDPKYIRKPSSENARD